MVCMSVGFLRVEIEGSRRDLGIQRSDDIDLL